MNKKKLRRIFNFFFEKIQMKFWDKVFLEINFNY